MPGFLVLVFICIWFTFMSAMPNVVATLRAVEPIHRSLGLGIESIILRYALILLRVNSYLLDFHPKLSNFKEGGIFFQICCLLTISEL